MTLINILNNITFSGKIIDCEISGIETNSRKVKKDSLFFCIKGVSSDGHKYAGNAIESGASYVVTEKDLGIKNQIIVENTRESLATACSNLYDNPSKKLKIVAVTGTNGKTSCTYIVKSLLEQCGYKVGLIGTIKNIIGDLELQAKYTTPEPLELNALMDKMVKSGCTHMVMEVSSHGLEQSRVFGVDVDVALFTNLTQDHLDYHKTMDNYFEAKKIAFTMAKKSIINIDDEYGVRLVDEIENEVTTYSIDNMMADVVGKNLVFSPTSVQFEVLASDKIKRVKFNMPGKFSVYNAIGAIGVALSLGVPFEDVISGISNVAGVRGRAEVLYDDKFTIICDYAHTPDGLEKFLQSIKPHVKGRLITLFGSAGERDWTKRAKMGSTVAKFSDYIILTSDNPRKEDPIEIIEHVAVGIEEVGTPYKAIADRYAGILWAVDMLEEGDVLCLAGKGHEDYQVLYGCTIYFDEHKIVDEILKKKGLK